VALVIVFSGAKIFSLAWGIIDDQRKNLRDYKKKIYWESFLIWTHQALMRVKA